MNVGCHTDAHEQARWFGDDIALKATKYGPELFSAADTARHAPDARLRRTPLHRIRVGLDFALSGRKELDGMVDRHAELARSLGEELGLGEAVLDALADSYERWDGKGFPAGLDGDRIPIASRIAHLAEFLEVAHRADGIDGALDLARRRSGTQFDPALVDVVCADSEKVFHQLDELDSWDAVIDGEPALTRSCSPRPSATRPWPDRPVRRPEVAVHRGPLGRGGEPGRGHGRRAGPARRGSAARAPGRTGSGFGRLGVSNAIWDKPGPLTAAEWERVRLYPQYTERMLHRSRRSSRRGGSPARWPSASTARATQAGSRPLR